MKNLILMLCLFISVLSCSKGSDSPQDEKSKAKPEVASLVFPLNNSECVDGTITSVAKSKVTFKWNTAKNTDQYELKVKNLQTGVTVGYVSSNSEITITLDRGIAYSWFIVSLNIASREKTQSSAWKFYNAGVGVSSYAPFPADDIAPVTGTEVAYTSDGITLKWSGNDVDNDILDYEIFLGESINPTSYKENSTKDSIENVIINKNTKYYWKIKTRDKQGNVSYSDLFQFKVN